MKQIATTTFRHGRVTLDKDSGYDVPDMLAGYFEHTGWTRAATPEEATSVKFITVPPAMFDIHAPNTTLNIQDVAHVAASEIKK